MRFINSRFYGSLELISNFFLLNLLWLLLSLPLLTAFPATAAMFGVIRDWKLNKQNGVFFSFFSHFKRNFKQSFTYGILWFIFAVVFYIDFMLLEHMGPVMNMLVMVMLLILGIIVTFVTIYLFPVMVHYDLKVFKTIKFSLFYSFMYIHITLISIVICALVIIISLFFPMLLVFAFSLTAHIIFSLCFKTFDKTAKKVNT